MAHHAFALGLEVQDDVLAGESSWNDQFERVKEGLDRLIVDVNTYKIEKQKLETTVLENEVAMNAEIWCVVDLERNVSCVETETFC